MQRITSASNPRVRHAIRLRESSRERRRSGESLVDGQREATRAAGAGVDPVSVFICEEVGSGGLSFSFDWLAAFPQWLERAILVPPPVFQRLAFGDRNEGVVAVIRSPTSSLDMFRPRPIGPLLVLDQVEKPGNVGAAFRTADGAGAAGILLSSPATDVFNPAAIRASLGTLFTVPLGIGTAEEILLWLRQHAYAVFAARPDATRHPWEIELDGRVAVVFGSESAGLSQEWSGQGIEPISLPMEGIADSLNVSVTAGVVLYESLRQRTSRRTTRK